MKQPSWTVNEIINKMSCDDYTRKQILEICEERVSLTLAEILDLDISDGYKIRICCGDHFLRTNWLERVMTRCITDHALHCGVTEVEQFAQRWLGGIDRSCSAANKASDAYVVVRAATKPIGEYIPDSIAETISAIRLYNNFYKDDAPFASSVAFAVSDAAVAAAAIKSVDENTNELDHQIQDMRDLITEMCGENNGTS